MSATVASLTLTPCGFFYRATLTKPASAKEGGGQVVGTTLVCGRTRFQALQAAQAIAARLSSSSAS